MTSATPSNEVSVEKEKFGATIYKLAAERAATEEGKKELSGFNVDQFLHTLKGFTDHIDNLPGEYSINVLYLTLNYLGSMVVHTMEQNKRKMMQQVGAKQ